MSIEADTILLVAQFSSAIASVIGIFLLVFIGKVIKHLLKDDFRKLFSMQGVFFLVVLIGVVSMTIYHFTDDTQYEEVSEITEDIWYICMFLSLPVSMYNSVIFSKFGKSVATMRKKIIKYGR